MFYDYICIWQCALDKYANAKLKPCELLKVTSHHDYNFHEILLSLQFAEVIVQRCYLRQVFLEISPETPF